MKEEYAFALEGIRVRVEKLEKLGGTDKEHLDISRLSARLEEYISDLRDHIRDLQLEALKRVSDEDLCCCIGKIIIK